MKILRFGLLTIILVSSCWVAADGQLNCSGGWCSPFSYNGTTMSLLAKLGVGASAGTTGTPGIISVTAANATSTDPLIRVQQGASVANGFMLAIDTQVTGNLLIDVINGSGTDTGTFYTLTNAGALSSALLLKAPTVNATTALQLNGNLALSPTAPTVSSGCGSVSTPTFGTGSTTASWSLTMGSTAGTSCVITLPTATNQWICSATDISTIADTTVQASPLANNAATFKPLVSWGASDVLIGACIGH